MMTSLSNDWTFVCLFDDVADELLRVVLGDGEDAITLLFPGANHARLLVPIGTEGNRLVDRRRVLEDLLHRQVGRRDRRFFQSFRDLDLNPCLVRQPLAIEDIEVTDAHGDSKRSSAGEETLFHSVCRLEAEVLHRYLAHLVQEAHA